jgi:hypothetical protein
MSSAERRIHQEGDIAAQLAEAVTICRAALLEPEFAGLAHRLPDAPVSAYEWFELLRTYPAAESTDSAVLIQRMKNVVNPKAAEGFPSIERYAVLQALTVALPRVIALPLPDLVKRRIANVAGQVAHPSLQWKRNFAAGSSQLMFQMAELATLRKFPVGELNFGYSRHLCYHWPLRFPPRAIPGFLLEVAFGVKGLRAGISPHINLWRPNPLFLRKVEVERSLWRMAKTLEYRPDVKFLESMSWLFSSDVSKVSPHLAWLRTIYEEAGAYIISMEPAPEDSGFKEQSPKRAELYDAGTFIPRRTMVLWRRHDFLTWAAQRMDLADEGESPPLPAVPSRSIRVRCPRPARAAKHNSPLHLWNGLGLLERRPRAYVLLVLILPALAIAGITGAFAWWATVPGFAAGFVAAWLFQYYAFQ